MQKLWILAGGLILAGAAIGAHAQVYHRGYTTQNGTYVAPHYQSAPDGNRFNNYSTQGNFNPYTGQPGTVNPYVMPTPYGSSYNRAPQPCAIPGPMSC